MSFHEKQLFFMKNKPLGGKPNKSIQLLESHKKETYHSGKLRNIKIFKKFNTRLSKMSIIGEIETHTYIHLGESHTVTLELLFLSLRLRLAWWCCKTCHGLLQTKYKLSISSYFSGLKHKHL